MTKRTCDVGSHGGMFQVAPEYWRAKQVHERKLVLPDTTDGKREKRRYTGDCNSTIDDVEINDVGEEGETAVEDGARGE